MQQQQQLQQQQSRRGQHAQARGAPRQLAPAFWRARPSPRSSLAPPLGAPRSCTSVAAGVASPQRRGVFATSGSSGSSSAGSSPVATQAAAEAALLSTGGGGGEVAGLVSSRPLEDEQVVPVVTMNGASVQRAANGAGAARQQQLAAEQVAQAPAQQQHQPEQHAAAATASVPVAAAAADEQAAKRKQFMNRVVFGVVLGLSGGALITVGQVPFLLLLIGISYQATQEFYGFITSQGIAKGMAPPPPVVSSLTTVLCVSMAVLAYMHRGRSSIVLAVSAFLLLVMQVIATKKPKFAQLASSLFGLFYCGWLTSFWVKMRMLGAAAPVFPYTVPFTSWLQGFTTYTVGLVATFTSVACVIAADTGAYFVGKSLGRTKLTDISPKKTVEGALGGLASSVAVAMGLQRLTQWPATPLMAAGLGVLIFFSSLFGDLIESIMKRDAGMKDSGDLIPGHGGLLDRVDSYMFTGAVSYFYIVFILPNFGLLA